MKNVCYLHHNGFLIFEQRLNICKMVTNVNCQNDVQLVTAKIFRRASRDF
jgi:hypothetical protein